LSSAPGAGAGVSAATESRRREGAAAHCATLLLETMPRVLSAVRAAVKNQKNMGLNVPQFRALIFLQQHAGESLSSMAEFLGLSLPAASKLADGLVKRGILQRQSDPTDRRRLVLRLSRKGNALLVGAQDGVRRHLAGMLGRIREESLEGLAEALVMLQDNFPRPGNDGRATLPDAPGGEPGREEPARRNPRVL
jgi:DNA-binding MarR family transcriptional regulator